MDTPRSAAYPCGWSRQRPKGARSSPAPVRRIINMHLRSELEQPRALEEMQAIIDTFANDRDEYPSPQVRLRTGVAKIVIEEYLPLFRLAQTLPGFKSASLTADSYPGPDANLGVRGRVRGRRF